MIGRTGTLSDFIRPFVLAFVLFAVLATSTSSVLADASCDVGADETFTNAIVLRGSDPTITTTIDESCTGTCAPTFPDGTGNVVLDTLAQTVTNKTFESGTVGTSTFTTGINVSAPLTWSAAQSFNTGTTVIATADINGGAIDGTTIGVAVPASGKFSTGETTGAMTVGSNLLLPAAGGTVNFNGSDSIIADGADILTFTGAASGYHFDDSGSFGNATTSRDYGTLVLSGEGNNTYGGTILLENRTASESDLTGIAFRPNGAAGVAVGSYGEARIVGAYTAGAGSGQVELQFLTHAGGGGVYEALRLENDQDVSIPNGNLDLNSNAAVEIGSPGTYISSTSTNFAVPMTTDQPRVLAYNSVTDTNVTGDATTVTVDFDTERYDDGSNFAADTWTATIEGTHFYLITGSVAVNGMSAGTDNFRIQVVTSNRTYQIFELDAVPATYQVVPFTVIADMESGDTAYITVRVAGGAKDVAIVGGTEVDGTWLQVYLLG